MQIVKRFSGVNSDGVLTQQSAAALPAGLVIPPGIYAFGDKNYICDEPGLYRFWTPMIETQQRIVYTGDVDVLMSALAWITANGEEDEELTVSQKTARARTGHVRMLCGNTCAWAKVLCDSFSNIGLPTLQTRIARALTAAAPTDYYDGHVMLEANVDGEWRLYDLAGGLTYGETPLSLTDALPLQPETLRNPIAKKAYSPAAAVPNEFHVAAWVENTLFTPTEFNSEWERVLQIPGIDHSDGKTYFYLPTGMESRESWVLGLSANYRVVPKSTWDSMFYPT